MGSVPRRPFPTPPQGPLPAWWSSFLFLPLVVEGKSYYTLSRMCWQYWAMKGTPMWNAGLRCTVDPSEPSGEGKMFDPEPRLRVSAFFVVMTALLTNAIQYPHNKKLSDP